ncbi:TonB family protein [Pelagicoccus sp. SDUM812002]|uniref:TonB family protein n=1 Tax=Pelagicoccus sp. SDUM812002 TaxID=3041266 RepID=UPI00280D3A5A|nr:TonB family protein [Pelagicoccus sp. SDUM812002]MDQ8188006.1 TonB family protein [Pelagicoccus sp. SDUM812002]
MNAHYIRLVALAAFGLSSILGAFADVYIKADGTSYDGYIYKVLGGSVYLRVGEDKIAAAVSEFDADSRAAIDEWTKENPLKVDVYTKWDVQPAIKASSMPSLPEQFLAEEFKGLVSVDLVLNEAGQVIHASIKKSTHTDLEAPSLEAAKTWIFEPAKVGGKSVRSKLRIPFKFVNNPPPPQAEEASLS